MLQQYHDTGHVDLGKVGEAAFNGAGVAVAVAVTVAVAATGIGAAVETAGALSAASAAGAEAACADGDCGNEAAIASQSFGNIPKGLSAISSEIPTLTSSQNVAMLDPNDELSQEGAAILQSNPFQPGAYHAIGHSPSGGYAFGVGGTKINGDTLGQMIQSDPNYKSGTPICLIVCFGGANYGPSNMAQTLANKLQVPVYAATSLVNLQFDTSYAGGEWLWFHPIPNQ